MRRRISEFSIDSDNSEPDIDVIAQTELSKLRREFRIMVGSRQAYAAESEDIIRRQLQEIQSLQDERNELQCNIQMTHRRRNQDAEATQDLCNMLILQDRVEAEIDREKQTLKSIKQEILKVEKEMAKMKQDKLPVIRRCTSHVLENKLDQGNIRCNKLLSRNRQLREDLKILHVERKQFQQLYSKLEKELDLIRRNIRDVMNKTTTVSDGRLDMRLKSMFLKEKTIQDVVQYNTELGELQRVISYNDQLRNFMSIKNQERTSQGESQDHPRKLEKEEKDKGLDLEASFKKIQDVLEEQDLDKIVSKFIEVEDWNFSSLNYVNEQHSEAEHIRDQIIQISEEIDRMNNEWQKQQAQHAALIQCIASQQQETERQRQAYDLRITTLNKILDQLKTAINAVLNQINCDRSAIDEKLGASCGNRENIIMAYLGLVEHHTNELLTIQSFINGKDLEKGYSAMATACHLLGKSPPLPQQDLTVRPPAHWTDSDTDECELSLGELTLSREELYEHALKKMQRRRNRPEVKTSRVSLGPNFRQRSLALP